MIKMLVIGYGNTLRGDDGAGVRAAEIIAHKYPDIECIVLTELVPELAEKITAYDTVLFVDASIETSDIRWRTIAPRVEHEAAVSHAVTPEALLELAINTYDRCPSRTLLAEIPARRFQYSETLSSTTQAMVLKLVAELPAYLDVTHRCFNAGAPDQSPMLTTHILPTGHLPS